MVPPKVEKTDKPLDINYNTMAKEKQSPESEALLYHKQGRAGKLEVIPSKKTSTQHDLSLAYSPGVAEPCLAIKNDKQKVFDYTTKGNLVAVISNGTAVLGLGNIGPEASKPVMEGKCLLFKIFADIDGFDIELNTENVEEFIRTVKILEPTFGGVNLEDIKSPECFEIEEKLRAALDIPVMHDDQHGTAIISAAALLNALEIAGKKIEQVKVVISGAGAAAVASANMYLLLGLNPQNLIMLDVNGVLNESRTDIDQYRKKFVTSSKANNLVEAIAGADVFIGLSVANILTPEMLLSMAPNPVVFALANPNPEIDYHLAKSTRKDVILATGRSDYPNQVNNVLGFPYIFRGALDVRAKEIDENMKMAAVKALVELAKMPVPDSVNLAYNHNNLSFGRDYLIPKPMDPRLIATVSMAVAKAAMESGLAQKPITDWAEYENQLNHRLGLDNTLMRSVYKRAQQNPKRVVFSDAENLKVLKAIQEAQNQQLATCILLGDEAKITKMIVENQLQIENPIIIDPKKSDKLEEYAQIFFEKRQRKGYNKYEAYKQIQMRQYFASMMVHQGDADCVISGLTRNYPDAIRPALEIIGKKQGVNKVSGMYILMTKRGPLFFSDTTINFNPNLDDLVEITKLTADAVSNFKIEPRIALLSYSNFGTAKGEEAQKMAQAVAKLQNQFPNLIVDGEIQAHLAFDTELLKENYPFSKLAEKGANTLIFPNLSAANIAYNLLKETSEIESIGPILLGLNKPVFVLQLGSSVREIVNMTAIAVVEAQNTLND